MTAMKKMIGTTLLGVTVLGGAASVGAGAASAAPNQPGNPGNPGAGVATPAKPAAKPNTKPAPNQVPQRAAPKTNGQNPNWRPGPVYQQGQWRTPIWDAGRNHWGFWLGPVWVPIG